LFYIHGCVFHLSTGPKISFYHYLFETDNYTYENALQIRELLKNNNLTINNVTFVSCQPGKKIPLDHAVIVSSETICEDIDTSKFRNRLTIPRLSDGGTIFYIYNDANCNKHDLKRFPYNFSFSDFAVEDLSEQRFCEKFITRQNMQ
jgi:hypothetical protein